MRRRRINGIQNTDVGYFLCLLRPGLRNKNEKNCREQPSELTIHGRAYLGQWICHNQIPMKTSIFPRCRMPGVAIRLAGVSDLIHPQWNFAFSRRQIWFPFLRYNTFRNYRVHDSLQHEVKNGEGRLVINPGGLGAACCWGDRGCAAASQNWLPEY